LLRDPYWALHAALEVGHPMPWPAQYLRAAPPGTTRRGQRASEFYPTAPRLRSGDRGVSAAADEGAARAPKT